MHAPTPPLTLLPRGPVDADVRIPGSKSITNRALLVAALAEGTSRLRGALVAEDATVMLRALQRLGVGVRVDPADPGHIAIDGVAGRWPVAGADLDLVLSGTSLRFLSAAVALGQGRFTLDGNARMRERPIGDLVDALCDLGVAASSQGGYPPVVVVAAGLPGGATTVAGDRSSQFLSGLLLAAPYADAPLSVVVTGELQSRPFVDLTIALMEDFGARVERIGADQFLVHPTGYRARSYQIEADAMAAGYAWGVAVMAGGEVRVDGVGSRSRQGDRRLLDLLGQMGCETEWSLHSSRLRAHPGGRLRGGRFDLNDLPDQAQTLAVLALIADAPVEITRVANLRIKETDRLHALATELRKFGALVDEWPDGLRIVPPDAAPGPVSVATYGDHRMAMAFALAGARWPGVRIEDPGCVAKTYPTFFDDLEGWGVGVRR
jgi:3-phosphoshikimate 1-carboxyvinyltransferase